MHATHPHSDPAAADTATRRDPRVSQQGQALVELAILLPTLLLIVLAAIDFGRVFQGWVVLNNAARVGANFAANNPTAWGSPGNNSMQAAYESLVQDSWSEAEASLTGCISQAVPAPTFPGGKDLGDFAIVQLDCPFTPLTPLIGDIFAAGGFSLTVSARSVFAIRTGSSAGGSAPPPACPSPNFTWTYPDPLDWRIVQFTDASSGVPSAWDWDFGDGASLSGQPNPLHTYAADGTYPVTLVTEAGTACEASHTIDVLVEEGATPPPGPQECEVPGLVGRRVSTAQSTWSAAGFTTTVNVIRPPNNDYTIEYQSLVGQSPEPCSADITVGPNPGGGGPGNRP